MTILDTIVARRREDVVAAKQRTPLDELAQRAACNEPAIGIVERLERAAPMALIAEVKRASPSKGDIAPDIDAAGQARAYACAGAAAISVLTEPTWFKGTLEDMAGARDAITRAAEDRPAILRKDFIFDPYQLVEARAYGADSVLLIVAALDDGTLHKLLVRSRELGMEPLVEVNNADEMSRARAAGARFIGINNRDLRDFSVDLSTTDRLAALAGEGVMLAALSGIHSREDVVRFAKAGARAVLVGEALMATTDPAGRVRELLGR